MTNNLITLSIPNDDSVALRAFGKALEEMARERQPHQITSELNFKLNIDTTDATAALEELRQHCTVELNDQQQEELSEKLKVVLGEPEIDTTAQQVESLAPRQEPLGDEIENIIKENLDELYVEAAPTTDSTGTPWDERIHSASKALNADGTWRLRRKPKDMDEAEWAALVESVKNELMGVDAEDLKEFEETKQAIIEPTREEVDELIEASNEMLVTIEPPVTPPGDDFHVVTEQTVAGIPPIPVPPPVVVPPVPHTIPVTVEVVNDWDFPKLMKFLTERHGKIDVPTVNQLLAVDGLAALTDLNAHPDKIGPFVARVKAHLGE